MPSFHSIEVSDPRFENEHLRQVVVKSAALGRRVDLTLFVPHSPPGTVSALLILLHGVYGSHWSWAYRAGIHRTAQRLIDAGQIQPLVLAMPSDGLWGDGSGYVPHRNANFEEWIVTEVALAAKEAAPCLASEPKLFLCGFSMGGYGALRLGAKYARRWSGVSAHSSITHISQMQRFVEEAQVNYEEQASDDDLSPLHWMKINKHALPPLRFDCGLQDDLLKGNRELHEALLGEGIPHIYQEFPGEHEWDYWEEHAVDTLRFVNGLLEPNRQP